MEATYQELRVAVAGHRGTIVLDRPMRGNSITLSMSAEIKRALTQCVKPSLSPALPSPATHPRPTGWRWTTGCG